MQLDTLTANIIVDNKPLEEYDVVSETPTRMTCWVPSEAGKSFAVQWECHDKPRLAHLEASVWVDGKGCGCALDPPNSKGPGSISCFLHAASMQDLVFARVQLSDDDSLLHKNIHKDLGEISLVIKRGQVTVVPRPAPCGPANPATLAGSEQLHERAKKATVHCVGFGPQRARVPPKNVWNMIPNTPDITFVFKYQPLDVLQANGIAPRPAQVDANASLEPENGPVEHDATPDDDDVSEDIKPAELTDRIQNLENELKRLRDLQTGNSQDRKPKRIKREEPRGGRKSLFTPGEVIDLT